MMKLSPVWAALRLCAALGTFVTITAISRHVCAVSACAVDCDQDGRVTVEELIMAVNITLEQLALDTCAAADVNGDGLVTVDELIAGVHAALAGCPTQTPTPSPSDTPGATPSGLPTTTPTPTSTPMGGCVEPFSEDCGGLPLEGSGERRCLGVTALADCHWTANVEAYCAYAAITQGNAGCGNGTVCFVAGLNGCHEAPGFFRVTVGDKSCYFTQEHAPTLIPGAYTRTPTPTALTPTPTSSQTACQR
jgi:hypothetical protein